MQKLPNDMNYQGLNFFVRPKAAHIEPYLKGKTQESQGGNPAVDEEPQFKLNFSLNLNVKPDHLV